MTDIVRCDECGSWEAQCGADKPVNGCACSRCLSHALDQEKTMRVTAEKFHDVAVKERDFERHLVNGLRRELTEYDCRRTGGPYSDISGRHCPLDKPCLTCKYEDLELNRASCCVEMEKMLNEVAPDWIGGNFIDIEACLKAGITEFAIRLSRAREFLNKLEK